MKDQSDDVKDQRRRAMIARPRDTGPTSVFACRADPRFSYCLYVPPQWADAGLAPELIVAVHGSARFFTSYRDAFAAFCRWNHCIVLAPLFPAGVQGDDNRDGYKYLVENDIRYDQVLLSMVDEVAGTYRCDFGQFALFGYSGGAHFAHRFFMLHPNRLWALSVGAPGSVTLLDTTRDWWVGVRDVHEVFGHDIDLAAMRRVPVQMIVGSGDVETYAIHQGPDHRYWMPGANDAGNTRRERLERLRDSFEANGIAVRFDVVRDVGHEALRCVPTAEDFLADVLGKRRGAAVRREHGREHGRDRA